MTSEFRSRQQSRESHHRPIRWGLLVLTVISTVAGVRMYLEVLSANGTNVIEYALVPLFTVLFSWIAFSFWTATAGLLVILSRREPLVSRGSPAPSSDAPLSETAVLMPIYNESPIDVFANVQAMMRSLVETGHAPAFDVFVLSDTTNPDVWLEEEQVWAQLVADHGPQPRVFYRRRPKNVSRKAGNIADFCCRWGAQYKFMIVLDADSVMEGETLVEMVRRMDADPTLGILQVPPTPVNRMSFFARLQQFSSRLYGEVFLQGFASWAHIDSNYWGHNAIIRVEPFTTHCGLPLLPGVAPLGGEILSHDFVEAALMARAGWKVALADDLGGSYEECPTTLLDFAKRDQRWCQGNLQHIRLIFSVGFRPISRLHLSMGAMSYLSSPLWMVFMILSVAALVLDGQHREAEATWFGGALAIFGVTMAMLLLPKLWSLFALTRQPARLREFGGWDNLIGSVVLETMVSILVAPIMMLFHTMFVLSTLSGHKVQWTAQNRQGGGTSFSEAVRTYSRHIFAGLLILAITAWLSPGLALWFIPIFTGLILAAPVAMALGSVPFGQSLADHGLLLIPEEIATPNILYYQQLAQAEQGRAHEDLDREKLFHLVVTDPGFHALHRNILQATDAHVTAPREEIRKAFDQVQQDGVFALNTDQKRMILSDGEALRRLHVHLRSQMRLSQSALTF